ncbi:murein hydrolase activator EnvC family protein [Donghicola tyrosinivorans]|uniref:Septal ring factor EnvC (AmiA/AmiB activator) n=1 Tax=Donghicola tyrosinivorans TaxID=1652492 RepID=A0A2T0WM30_9RHOB|nr:peptidoglycan DD-metalloendopeptidase family protein [Pseudomonadota bacterium]MEE3072050.1 peptidoglycan DD-metalloendopeptidase family protein [Pseudomonadota bacterium]PRY87756.1 septal ring factor EnvC (AmiA/AmiB activator) [Donghicola tyrosinivorans]
MSLLRAVCLALSFAAPAMAQDDPAAAALAAKEQLQAAHAALDAASGSQDRVEALTRTVQAYEAGLQAMRNGLRRAAIRETALRESLDAKRDEVSALLGTLQTIGRAPAPMMLMHPSGPTGTARAGMILSDISPAVQSEVNVLSAQLDEVRTLRALQQTAAETLRDGLQGVQEARTELSKAISDRVDLPRRFSADPVKEALLIASAETLEGFAGGLSEIVVDDIPEGEGALQPFVGPEKGDLPLPVQGTILRMPGEADAAGIPRPGIIIATEPGALVTNPSAATVRYAGPLLDYGNVIILEPEPDILFVLAGMEQVYGEVGQVLPAGDPVGLMGGERPAQDAVATQTGASQSSETLYLEIREGQQPVDPAEWFKTDKD